jgi:hypothetical protein
VLLASANISIMSISPTTADAKAPSKFHCRYHEQLRMQAKMRQAKALSLFLNNKSVAEIADVLVVNYSTAWRYIRREVDACRLANTEKAEAIRKQLLHVYNKIVKDLGRVGALVSDRFSERPNH